jgi:hypothetical protein
VPRHAELAACDHPNRIEACGDFRFAVGDVGGDGGSSGIMVMEAVENQEYFVKNMTKYI